MKLIEELLVSIFQLVHSYFLFCCLRSLIENILKMSLQQPSLLEKIFYTGQKNLAMEWFGNVGISTMLISFGTMFLQFLAVSIMTGI